VHTASHDWMVPTAESGCLVIADVSGYTRYLQDSELEHAQDVLADLSETIIGHLGSTLRINRLEGDAAFAYAPEPEIEASMLLDTIEETYFAFRSRLRDIQQATTCDCNACLLIPGLDLKFVAHLGRFMRKEVAGHEELTGTDVIIVHRLLKNSVKEKLELRGYALLTDACVLALGIDPVALEMHEHRESYGDVGEVLAFVVDLERRWSYEQERRRVFVLPDQAQLEFVTELPAPAPLVWEYFTSPRKRLLWQTDFSRIDQTNPGGRRGPGTTNHCVHGRGALVEEILDWRPFRYYSHRMTVPGLGPWIQTVEFRPLGEETTEVRIRGQRLQGAKRLLLALMRRMISSNMRENAERLRQILQEPRGPEDRRPRSASSRPPL
jgi:hypothetical protein